MTLIESMILAALHGFGRFIPISSEAHGVLLERLVHFPAPDLGWKTTFALGTLLALFIYFIHDWASILSSLIQVAVYRKRPMTLDERYGFFMVACSVLPFASLWYLTRRLELDSLNSLQDAAAAWIIPGLIAGSVLLWLSERWSKKNRGPFNLGVIDSILLGVGQMASWIPGVGGSLGMLSMSQFRNYHLEAATKAACLMSLPFVAYEAFQGIHSIQWGATEPLPSASWLQWSFSIFIATIGAFTALKLLNEHVRQSGFGKILVYRAVIALTITGLHFWG